MGYNIGPKIGIDGEQEFRNSIRKINDTYKALEAETRAVAAAFDAQGDEQGKLEATSKQLQKQIDNQKSKMSLLEDAVKKASEKFGENSIEATRLRGALYDTQATVSKLEAELQSTADRLAEADDAMEDFAEETEQAGDAAIGFGDILKANVISDVVMDGLRELGSLTMDVAEAAIEASAEVKAENAQFAQTFKDLKKTATQSLDAIADDVGTSTSRMQKSFTKIYAFVKSIGADSEEAMDISERAMRAAADSAAYYDTSLEEATETLQSFLKGNYENDAALGIAATETSRNAEANRKYAKSFNELAESQKVDVLLSMVEAGNKASGAFGQAASEAEAWTNVTGEAEEAWRQLLAVWGDPLLESLTPIVQSVTGAIKELAEKTAAAELHEEIDDFVESWEKAEEAFANAETQAKTNAAIAEHYVSRLEKLEAAGLNTADAQREYADTVSLLSELYPDLNLVIDENTGLLKNNKDAVLASIDAMKKQAVYDAAMRRYSDSIKLQAEATVALQEAQYNLSQLQGEAAPIVDQLAEALGLTTEEVKRQAHTMATYGESTEGVLTPALRSLANQLNVNLLEQDALNLSITDSEQTIASYEEELKHAMESLGYHTEATEASTDALDDNQKKQEQLRQTINAIQQAYADAKDEALDSINSQIGLFEELSLQSDYSAEKILANWKKQQQAFREYRDNLQKAVDMGLDLALVQQLSDTSTQSMMILDALVNDVAISVDEINAEFRGISESKDMLASTLGQISVLANEELTEMAASASKSGVNFMEGLIAGVESRKDAFKQATASVGKFGLAGFNQEMAINSPAKKMIPSGEYTVEGAILGVKNRADAFTEAMADLALAGENSFLSVQLQQVGSYPSMVQSPASYSRSVSHHYGGQTFQIYQQPGESSEDLADRIMAVLQQQVDEKEAVFR